MTAYYTMPEALKSVLEGITFKTLLLTDACAYAATTEFVSEVVAHEATPSASRQSIAGAAAVNNADPALADGANFTPSGTVLFPAFSATVKHVIIFNNTGDDATSRIWHWIDLETPVIVSNKKFKVNFNGPLVEVLA